jgi:hypothetical protein
VDPNPDASRLTVAVCTSEGVPISPVTDADTRMPDELLSLSFVAIALPLSECVQLLSL